MKKIHSSFDWSMCIHDGFYCDKSMSRSMYIFISADLLYFYTTTTPSEKSHFFPHQYKKPKPTKGNAILSLNECTLIPYLFHIMN